jgi:hypothetical protein
MVIQKFNRNIDVPEGTAERKAYETPELKQLGTLEELTRWEASVTVGG